MRTILALIIITLTAVPLHAQDTKKSVLEVKWRNLTSGAIEAKKANKKVLLDVYTDWCKWCKKLDAEVYNEAGVAAYLQKKYVTVKVNAESDDTVTFQGKKMTGPQLAQAFGVTGYPTIIFLDSDSKPIDKLGGFVDASKFLPIIRFIGEDAYKTMSWEDFQKKQ